MSFRRHIREQVLRATRELTIEKGWEQVRVSEVAEVVGVSRPTLYKEFGDKQGLGDALVVAEGQRFLEGIHAILAEHTGDVQGGITAAVRFTLREAEASPLLKSVLTSNHSGDDRAGAPTTGVLPLLPTSASLLQLSSAALVAWFHDHFADLDSEDVEEVADVLVRLTVSHVVLPSADISLYAGGMTLRDIENHLAATIGSRETLSKIVDEVCDEVLAWQRRPLEVWRIPLIVGNQ